MENFNARGVVVLEGFVDADRWVGGAVVLPRQRNWQWPSRALPHLLGTIILVANTKITAFRACKVGCVPLFRTTIVLKILI